MSQDDRKQLTIKKAWWKGNDFHVVSECGEYLVFRNCYMKERRMETFVDDGVVVQEWDFNAASRMELVKDGEEDNTEPDADALSSE